MASPWITPTTSQQARTERPWMGMAMLAAVPLISLVLIRLLWSGSSLWFLTVGIILLGSAAVVFLARRQQDDHGPVLTYESGRVPIVLAGLGVLFLAMLLLPNFADGASDSEDLSDLAAQQPPSSEVSGVQSQPTVAQEEEVVQAQPTVAQVQPTAVEEEPAASEEEVSSSVVGQTYVVAEGDTLWDIGQQFGVGVEEIVSANGLADEADIQIGQELIIPGA